MQLVPKMSWIERLCTVYNLLVGCLTADYRGLLDVDTLSAPFFEVSIRRSNIKTWSPNKVSLLKKKKKKPV